MIAPVTHILPLTKIRRARLLEDHGTVHVRIGQDITAVEVVAEAASQRKHRLINIPAALGISREEFSRRLVHCKVGDSLEEGDILAEVKKLLKRVVRAPVASKVLMISGGMILLEELDEPIKLQAGFSSSVVEVLPDRGVILESTGALIQGIWGNGKINQGLLMILVNNPAGEIEANHLEISMRGSVVMIGHCSDADVIKAAAELPLNGLIMGSMSSSLVPIAESVDVPIIVLDGFGHIPMNQAAFKIIRTNEKRDVSVNACKLNHFLGERPEIFIPLPSSSEFAPETDLFKTGQTVRILCDPGIGEIGIIDEIYYEPIVLENGMRMKAAKVRLETTESLTIPLNNLEVLE